MSVASVDAQVAMEVFGGDVPIAGVETDLSVYTPRGNMSVPGVHVYVGLAGNGDLDADVAVDAAEGKRPAHAGHAHLDLDAVAILVLPGDFDFARCDPPSC